MNKKLVAPIVIFLVLSFIRLADWEGYAPMLAITFFAGAVGLSWRSSMLMPLVGLLLGDVMMAVVKGGTYLEYFQKGEFLGNYPLYLVSIFLGYMISNRSTVKNIVTGSIISILVFFFVSNLMVWAAGLDLNSQPYTKDMNGLMLCYTNGLPYLIKSIVGNGIATVILFGSYAGFSKNLLNKVSA